MFMGKQLEEKPLILIVDDASKNLEVLGFLLKKDYQINLADNGYKAIEMAKKNSPFLILLDIMMPGIDGLETCKELKKLNEIRDVPVIFLTGRTRTEDIVKGFEAGAVDYVTKPFNTLELKVRIKNHIDLRQKTLVLQSLSERDGLTMIPNRRRFQEFLNTEWRRCSRNRSPISLSMIDIDYFKLYNDHYGHLAGDKCLKKVANAIAGCLYRPGDLAARYGGEEFSVVMSDTDLPGAIKLAERIDASIKELELPHADSPVSDHLTLSIGIGAMAPDARNTPEQLIQTADDSLYAAKNSGRDQIKARIFPVVDHP
ncbi:MAG: diguanylate cyclase [Desulfobacterales bacterium]|nr:diguanylate cyclase [Desulfobacterales bacterium]